MIDVIDLLMIIKLNNPNKFKNKLLQIKNTQKNKLLLEILHEY